MWDTHNTGVRVLCIRCKSALVMCCGIVLHTLVLEVPSCWSAGAWRYIGLSTFRVLIVLRSRLMSYVVRHGKDILVGCCKLVKAVST